MRRGVEALNKGCSDAGEGKARIGEGGVTGSGESSSRLDSGLVTRVNLDCQFAI